MMPYGRITGCSLEQLKLLQLAFRERVVPVDDPQAFKAISVNSHPTWLVLTPAFGVAPPVTSPGDAPGGAP